MATRFLFQFDVAVDGAQADQAGPVSHRRSQDQLPGHEPFWLVRGETVLYVSACDGARLDLRVHGFRKREFDVAIDGGGGEFPPGVQVTGNPQRAVDGSGTSPERRDVSRRSSGKACAESARLVLSVSTSAFASDSEAR